jgi:polyhydroxyalkanoate synthase subunit PhaC
MSQGNGSTNAFAKAYQALVDEGLANVRRMSRLPSLWEQAQRVRKGATPSNVVYDKNRIKLLHYETDEEPRYKTPLVFIFGLVNRPYILDLKAGKSVVEHFVKAGFDTYMIDWGIPVSADRHRNLDDYVNGYMVDIFDHVRERTGVDQANVLAYCMGGTMTSMFIALHPGRVRNLILLAAAIDFASRDGLLNVWTSPEYFDVDALIDTYGNCPAELLQGAFMLLKPVSNLAAKQAGFIDRMDDEDFVDDFLTMETWLNDNIPQPGQIYRQFVKDLYQKNLLTQDKLVVGGRTVRLKDITCPVLNLMASNDYLVPPAQSLPFNDLVGSSDREQILFPSGHVGMAVGGRTHRELWPKAVEWLRERTD